MALGDRAARPDQVLADVARVAGVPLARDSVVDDARVTWDEVPGVIPPEDRADLLGRLDGLDGIGVAGAWLAGNGLAAVVSQAKEVARCV